MNPPPFQCIERFNDKLLFSRYADSLLSNPIVMVKSWSNLQGQRTQKLLEELVENDVDNFSKLQKSFKKNENFIKNAYLNWYCSPKCVVFQIKFFKLGTITAYFSFVEFFSHCTNNYSFNFNKTESGSLACGDGRDI